MEERKNSIKDYVKQNKAKPIICQIKVSVLKKLFSRNNKV